VQLTRDHPLSKNGRGTSHKDKERSQERSFDIYSSIADIVEVKPRQYDLDNLSSMLRAAVPFTFVEKPLA